MKIQPVVIGFLICLFSILNCQAQDLNGYTEQTEGNIVSKGFYENGKKDGVWISEVRNGNITKIESYKNGTRQGPFIEFSARGYICKAGILPG